MKRDKLDIENMKTNKQILLWTIIAVIVAFIGAISLPSVINIDGVGVVIIALLVFILLIFLIPLYLEYKYNSKKLINWGALWDLSQKKMIYEEMLKRKIKGAEEHVKGYNESIKILYLFAIYEGRKKFATEFLDKLLIKKRKV